MEPRSLRKFASLAFAAACTCAQANVIYKSVERDGRITFSDRPLDGAVVLGRVESSDSVKPAVGDSGGGPVYLALADGFDDAVRLANSRVDLAEHALAAARRSVAGNDDPLSLNPRRASPEDLRQLEFHKAEVTKARRNLMRVLQQRNALTPRPVA